MKLALIVAVSFCISLPLIGAVMRHTLRYEQRPALYEASLSALFFKTFHLPYRWLDSEVERIRSLMFANQRLNEIAIPINESGPEAAVIRMARAGSFQSADQAAAGLPNLEQASVVLLRAYIKQQLGQVDASRDLLRKLANREDVETRYRLWAFGALREQGEAPRQDIADELLGLVVETEVDGGVDSLAMYPDKRLLGQIAAVGAPAKAVYLILLGRVPWAWG